MSMKKYLDILDGKRQLNEDISECGDMQMQSPTQQLSMNLNLSAQGINNIKDVLNLINMADRGQPEPMNSPASVPMTVTQNQPDELHDIMSKAGISRPVDDTPEEGVMGALGGGALGATVGGPLGALTGAAAGSSLQNTIGGNDDEADESYQNEPEESYQDHEFMTKDLSGGINKPHKQFRKGYPGADNAMSIYDETVDTIKDRLLKEYAEFKESDEDLMQQAIRSIPPETVHALADQLAKGEISLQDFNNEIQSAAYTDYSMRRGEMGYDKMDQDDAKAWDREKGEWDDWDDREREYDDEDF